MKCLNYLYLDFPCGQCMACRLNKQREKAMRISHELQYHNDNVFVTLTYKPEMLPKGATLVKADMQKFMKRVRKAIEPDQVRFFGAGEYGELGLRPHYHLILFGISVNDKRVFDDLHYLPGLDLYKCTCKCWDKGFVSVGKVTEARVNYVAKYVVKKVTGKLSADFYGDKLPEFCLCSRNPGLGYQYAEEHLPRMKADNCCVVRGKKTVIPRYYVDKFFSDEDKSKKRYQRLNYLEDQVSKDKPLRKELGTVGYRRLLEDKLQTAKEILAKRLQRKGNTKCQIE